MSRLHLTLTFLLAFPTGVLAQENALKNEDVVKMLTAELSEQIIVATIQSQATDFDLNPQALIALKESGVPETIMAVMIEQSSNPPSPREASLTEVVLPDGTEVKLRLLKTISSETARVGDRVDFEVVEDVVVDEVTVIQKEAKARGEVIEARKKKSFGRKGKLNFTIEIVEAVDGQNIRLRSTKSFEGDEQYGKAAVVTILTGPFGWFVKGKNIEVLAGEQYTIYINGDRRINLQTLNEPADPL